MPKTQRNQKIKFNEAKDKKKKVRSSLREEKQDDPQERWF